MVKGIVSAFDHKEFCLVLTMTTVSASGKWAVMWPPVFATRYVSLLPTSAPGSKYHCAGRNYIVVVSILITIGIVDYVSILIMVLSSLLS